MTGSAGSGAALMPSIGFDPSISMVGDFFQEGAVAARLFLGINVLVWVPYGVYCFFAPGFLAEAAGVASLSPTGTTELRAMYGGLQIAIGVLCALGLFRAGWQEKALHALGILTLGLGSARLIGAALDGAFSQYTIGALVFEFGLAGIALLLANREQGG